MRSDHGELDGRATFEVAGVPSAILSAGNLIQKGFRAVLDLDGSYLEKNGKRVKLVMKKNSFYLPANVCSINGESNDGDENMTGGSNGSNVPLESMSH